MGKSIAMFLLVGKQLVTHQASSTPDWKYTENWIAYETGLACRKGIDVWVLCDGVEINLPVPYLNNYEIHGMSSKQKFEWLRGILEFYNKGDTFPAPLGSGEVGRKYTNCPNSDCGIDFNLHSILSSGQTIKCPQCSKDMLFENGFLTPESSK